MLDRHWIDGSVARKLERLGCRLVRLPATVAVVLERGIELTAWHAGDACLVRARGVVTQVFALNELAIAVGVRYVKVSSEATAQP